MRWFRKVAGFLGFGGHDNHNDDDDANHNHNNHNHNHMNTDDVHNHRNRNFVDPIPGPRKGFSVPVQVPVDRPVALGPVLKPCNNGDGGVQGLRWYARKLKIDEDGDVADEFFHEVLPDMSPVMQDQQKPMPRLQVKHNNVRHAKVRSQAMAPDGKLLQHVECQGRLLWV